MRLLPFLLLFCAILFGATSVYAASEAVVSDSTRIDSISPGFGREQFSNALADSARTDSNRIRMLQYIGVSSTMTTDHRTLGLPSEFATPYGNAPLTSIGINAVIMGDLLFKTNQLRTSTQIEKFLNAYPSSKIMENWRLGMQFGYYIFEQPNFKAYPFIGFGMGFYYVGNGVRVGLYNAEGGAGLDYFIPKTPLLLGVQASYNHNWNLRAAKETTNNIGGLAVRAQVSVFIREKFNYWGWD
jgi:hypothetical protein